VPPPPTVAPPAPAGTTLFTGGTVLPRPSGPVSDALLVGGGTVLALGDAARERAGTLADGPCTRHDLDGGTLLPAFRDGHAHPLWGGVDLGRAPVTDAASLPELLDRLARWAEGHPEPDWVHGGGYPPALAPGGDFDAAWLDAVLPHRPVTLQAQDYHTTWANSRALALAGVDAGTPDPPAGRVVRRPDGSPLGTLRESAQDLVLRHVPAPTRAQRDAGLRAGLDRFAAAGVAWVLDAAVEPADVDVYLDAAATGTLPCRVGLALRACPQRWRDQRAELREAREEVRRRGGDAVTGHTVKIFADGVIEGGTAALLQPYLAVPGGPAPDPAHPCGLPAWPAEELAAAVAAFDADGFDVHVHAIGDAAIRDALDAVERAVTTHGPRDRRHVIAHTQLVAPDDLPRFAALGVIANLEPLWACLDPCQTELTLPRLGELRGSAQYPFRSLLDAGARLSFGSDWPVTSLDPWPGIAVAVSRRVPAGPGRGADPEEGWLPHQRTTLAEALAAYTTGTAYQARDGSAGVLDPGCRADLVLVPADPRGLDPAGLAELPVLGTWLGGRQVHGG